MEPVVDFVGHPSADSLFRVAGGDAIGLALFFMGLLHAHVGDDPPPEAAARFTHRV